MADDKKRKRKTQARVWKRLIKAAKDLRKPFDEMGEEALNFFAGSHDHVFDDSDLVDWGEWPKVTINKVWELVRIYGPALYHQNPTRTVTTRSSDPMKIAFAKVGEILLNSSAYETGLKKESRRAILSALVFGRGILWPGLDEDRGVIGAEYVRCEDFLVDPDARNVDEIRWAARRRREPVWMVEELFPGAKENLRESVKRRHDQQSEGEVAAMRDDNMPHDSTDQPGGVGTNDMIIYWEIFSKMGDGFRAHGASDKDGDDEGESDQVDERHIVIAENIDVPLAVGDWPAPLFLDGTWFHTILDFVENPKKPWPYPFIRGAQGEQETMDFLFSFMLAKAKNSSKDIVAVAKHLDEEVKTQIIEGKDLSILEIDMGNNPMESIGNLVQFLRHPEMPMDLQAMFDRTENLFQQRTGMSELLYGTTNRQLRSAREADIKDRNARVTVEDMQEQVSDWQSEIARKEMILARFLLEPEEVERIVGSSEVFAHKVQVLMNGQPLPEEMIQQVVPMAAGYFSSAEEAESIAAQIMQTQGMQGMDQSAAWIPQIMAMPQPVTAGVVWEDMSNLGTEDVVREFDIRIESTSARRPDRNFQIDQARFILEQIMPLFLQTGDLEGANNLLKFAYQAHEIPREHRSELQAPPPPPEQGPGGEGGPGAMEQATFDLLPGTEGAVMPGG